MDPNPDFNSNPRHRAAELRTDLRALHPAITPELLTVVVEYGHAHSSQCTANDVDWMEGTLAQGKPMRRLRELLIPHGFKRGKVLPTVINPDGTFQIASMRGDLNTGKDAMPKSLTEKGPLTCAAVSRNAPPPPRLFGEAPEVHIQTWVLLTYVEDDEETGDVELRAELSLPTYARETGRKAVIEQFEPRYKLEPIHITQAQGAEDDDDGEDEIDIDVRRRTG